LIEALCIGDTSGMTRQLLFLLIDGLAIFSILVLGAGVLKSSPRSLSAWIFAIIAFNTACFQIWSRYAYGPLIPEPYRFDLGDWRFPIQFMMNSTPGLFMVMTFTLFSDEKRFPRWLIALFVLQLVLDIPSLHVVSADGMGQLLLQNLPAVLQLTLVGVGLYWTVKDWRNDVVETRRLLRLVFIAVVGVMTFGVTLIERLLIRAGGGSSFYFHEAYNGVCVVLNAVAILVLISVDSFERSRLMTAAAPAIALPAATVDRDFSEFDRAMRERHLYREAGLSIAVLALKLSIPEYRLRRLINVKLGFRNFNAMLNHYRVEEAATALADPAQRNTPILTIALTYGFQSINPFNRAFRELRGMAPSDFRRQQLAKE
jgi:AraC-like DNA-binding protein